MGRVAQNKASILWAILPMKYLRFPPKYGIIREKDSKIKGDVTMEFVISMVAVLISISTFLFTVVVEHKKAQREKKQATLDAINTLQEQVFDKLNEYTYGQVAEIATSWTLGIEKKNEYVDAKLGTANEFWAEHHEYDAAIEDYRKISSYLARIEHFALGVNTKIYDPTVTERATTKYFISLYGKLLPILAVKNGGTPTDKIFENKYFQELERLINHLKKIDQPL